MTDTQPDRHVPMAATARLRILFVDPIGHVLGSHDREICRHLAERGHRVVLVTNERYPYAAAGEPFTQMATFGGVVGDRHVIRKGLNYAMGLLRVWRQVRQLRPDAVVLYYHLLPALDWLLLASLKRRAVRTVLCAHDPLPLGREQSASRALGRLCRSASAVLTFSRFARGVVIDKVGVAPDKVRALFLGVDVGLAGACRDRRGARRQLNLPDDGPIVLCFGQIKPNKGLQFLLPAFGDVLGRHRRARLLIVGRPWKVDLEPFIRQAGELGIAERVTFRPQIVPEDEVTDYFCAADVVVLPYTHVYQSAVLVTASSLGRPIVATRVGGVPELLQDGTTGYLVPPRDPAALAEAITEALGRPDEAARRGERARQAMAKRYSWSEFCRRLEEVLIGAPADAR